MDLIWEGIREALRLLLSLDPEVLRVTLLSLALSGLATLVSLLLGVSLGVLLALTRFPGRRLLISLVNTGMGLPPVVVGLLVTILVIAQAVIATPIIAGLSLAALQQLPPNLRLQILTLGASKTQMVWLLIREARLPLLAAVMAGFGGVISEVGASIMVGGNIKGSTRVLTTATVMETSKGNFEVAIALSVILLALAFAVNAALTHLQQRRRPR